MRTKEKYIRHLQQARTEHVRWVNQVKSLISGVDIDSKIIPINPTESPFGKWYYEKAILFSLSNSRSILEEIEKHFLILHELYMKIYPIYFSKKNSGLLGSMFRINRSISAHETDLAQHYYGEIVALSDQLKNKLRIFENQLHATAAEKFDDVYRFEKITIQSPAPIEKTEEESGETYYFGARSRS